MSLEWLSHLVSLSAACLLGLFLLAMIGFACSIASGVNMFHRQIPGPVAWCKWIKDLWREAKAQEHNIWMTPEHAETVILRCATKNPPRSGRLTTSMHAANVRLKGSVLRGTREAMITDFRFETEEDSASSSGGLWTGYFAIENDTIRISETTSHRRWLTLIALGNQYGR